MAGEGADDDPRQRWNRRAPDELEYALPSPHDRKESRVSRKCK
jgi:hypothetical protein